MIATMKIVRRAATDDNTGEVREIKTRKEPENAARILVSRFQTKSDENLLALANTEMPIIQACSPRGSSKVSSPRK